VNGGGRTGNGGADSAVTDTSTDHPIPVAFDTVTATNAANRDYAQPVFAALDGPFATVTNGYAGAASDGLTQLDAGHALTAVNDSADTGNVVQVAEVKRNRDRDEHSEHGKHGDDDGAFTMTLGFGATQDGPSPPLGVAARTSTDPRVTQGLGALRQEVEPASPIAAGHQ
jgi:hypothetical protein